MNLKKKEIDSGVILILSWDYIHLHGLYCQIISQISGERLQDHWSSGMYSILRKENQRFY